MGSRVKKYTVYHAFFYFILSVLFVGMACMSIASYVFLKKTYLNTAISQSRDVLSSTINDTALYIQSAMHNVHQFAQHPEIMQFLKADERHRIFSDKFKKKLTDFAPATVIFSAKHAPLFTSMGALPDYDKNHALDDSIQRSLILSQPDISDFFFTSTQTPLLFITVPVFSDTQFVGSVAAAISMDALNKIVSHFVELKKIDEIIIIKDINNEIKTLFPTPLHPQAFQKYTDSSAALDIAQQAVKGIGGHSIGEDNTHKKSLFVWQYMPLTEWGVIVKRSYKDITTPLLKIKLLLAFFIIICSTGAGYFLYKSWPHAQKTLHLDLVIARMLMIFIYIACIITLIMAVFFIKKEYDEYYRFEHKDLLLFKGSLQKAAQTIDYRIAALENIADSLAFDLMHGVITPQAVGKRLEADVNNHSDIAGISCAFKQNKEWHEISCIYENDLVKMLETEHIKELPWVHQAAENQASWIFVKNNMQNDKEPMYTVPFYKPEDIEQKSPEGFISLMYTKNAMIENARPKISNSPLLLALNEGTIIYHDKDISIDAATENILHAPLAHLYYEKIAHLGWYLGSIYASAPLKKTHIFVVILVSIMVLGNIIIFIYSFLRYVGSLSINNKFLLYAWLCMMFGISIIYWLIW